MKYDEFVKLGKEAGFTGKEGEEVAVKIGRLVKLVEQATLERAANTCEEQADRFDRASPFNGKANYAAIECAKAILALKDSND